MTVALEELDANNDDRIELSEVEAFIDRYVLGTGPARSRNAEVKGYLLTVASLIDLDDDGMLTRSGKINFEHPGFKDLSNLLSYLIITVFNRLSSSLSFIL